MRRIAQKIAKERVIFIASKHSSLPCRHPQRRAVLRAFSLGVGIIAIACLIAVQWLPNHRAQAASAFPSGGTRAAPTAAQTDTMEVIPLGSSFGLKLYTDGVIITSLSELYTTDGICCPAEQAGLQPGDYLTEVNETKLKSNADLAQQIGKSDGKSLQLTVRRDDTTFFAELTPVFSAGSFKAGMWVRDSAAGIGTLTFYDPDSGCFAGLGHGICDMDVGSVMRLSHGDPAPITLCGIVKGTAGQPGQLQGYFPSDETLGTLLANNETGVYGTLNDPPEGNPIIIVPAEEVVKGPAQIYTTVDDTGAQWYDAQLTRVLHRGDTKNLVVKITDERLLSKTGGIVQGMSGSPIVQNGKLVGCVTHVFTDDPTQGYGIFAETMYRQLRATAE